MPDPIRDWEKEILEQQRQSGQAWEQEIREQMPETVVQRGEIREELASRFQFGWRERFESLPGYIPEAIQSDYALKLARNQNLNYMKARSFNYNDALPEEWSWRLQNHPSNLDKEGKPLNQFGESLPYGAVEWTPQGNASYRGEGEGMLKGIWNKYWSTLTAPYGAESGEGSKYKPVHDDTQRLLKAGVITPEEARKREAEDAQTQGFIQDRIGFELAKETGEKADLATMAGRAPKAILNAWIQAVQLPAYEAKRVFAVTEDLVATAYKDLGIPMPYEVGEPPEWMGVDEESMWVQGSEERNRQQQIAWEAYFADAPIEVGDYFRESYIDKELAEGGPLDASRQAGRIFYTGLLEPLTKAEYIRRYRNGEDPYMLQLELENVAAEAVGETIFDPLYVVGLGAKRLRDGIRLGNITQKFLGQTPGIDAAIDAIKTVQKGKLYPEATNVYEIAAGSLKVDNVNAFSRWTKFRDKTGVFVRTNAAKQHFMNRVAGEVFKGITSTTLDPQKQADAFRAIVLMSSSSIDEIKQGMILASNFEMPKLLYSDAARHTGFMLRQMMKNEDGVIDTARFLKQLQAAQDGGVVALAKFGGTKLDNAIDELYPSVSKRLAATADAHAAIDAGKELSELTALQKAALVDKIPKYVKTASRFDASKFGTFKRWANNIFASIYMGYNPGWLWRNAQNNVLTTVVDQGIEGLRYWHSEGAVDNIASWVGKMDVEGFGGITKMGIIDIEDYDLANLPDEIQEMMSYSKEIQDTLDQIGIARHVPGTTERKQAEVLVKELKSVDYDLRNKMKTLGLKSPDIGEATAGFKYAEQMEMWSGKNVVSAAVERSMLKMLKPGKAIPDVSTLINRGMPEPLANHLVSTVVRKKGDIYGAVAEISNDIKKGESIFVMAGRAHLPDDIARQLQDMRWMQQYDDIVIGGFIRGEPRDAVIKKFRAATIEGWEELATKVSDDVVTLTDDVDGAERIRNAAQLATADKAIDEQHVARVFTYRGLNHQSSNDIRVALDKARSSAAATGDTATLDSVDDLIAVFDQGGTELTARHNQMLDDVLVSRGEKLSTPQEMLVEWNKRGLEGAPPANMTLSEFTDIRWREMYFEPTRRELAAARDVMYKDFQTLLESSPDMVVDQHFLDEVNRSYLRSVAYDPVLRADEIRKPLSAARKAEDWDEFARILAHQYGIESVAYEGGRAIHNDVKVLNIVNENIGTDYVRLRDIPENELNEAFLRHASAEYALKNGLDAPDYAPLAKAAEEVDEIFVGVPNDIAEPGVKAIYGGEGFPGTYQKSGAPIRGTVIGLDDERIPDTVYHVTTNAPAIEGEGLIRAGGAGGLGGDQADQIVSMTVNKDIALNIENDLKWVSDLAKKHQPNIPEYGIDRTKWAEGLLDDLGKQAKSEGWDMGVLDGMKEDYAIKDWLIQYFYRRADDADIRNPQFWTEIEDIANIDAAKVGIIEISKEQLDTGALITDLDLGKKFGLDEIRIYGDVPLQQATRPATTAAEAVPTRPFMPPIGDNTPLLQRAAAETRDGAADLINRVETSIHDNWGKTMPNMDGDTKALLRELKTWADEGYTRIAEAKLLSRQVGYAARDFALHSYPQKYGFDIALSYIYPYEFWHTRTYAKWMSRALTDPAVVAMYGRYRNTLEKIHAGAPEWWKYNVNTNELLGIDAENPIYFNLEASLNPLYGMTGVDFNDPQKRVNWWTTAIDNLGKWGPGMWTLINWSVASVLAIQGETDAAQRWAGRLTPQSRFIKAGLSLAGINIDNEMAPFMREGVNEFDPVVLLASKGIDPYEYQRVIRELGGMVDNGEIETAQMIDAFIHAEGEAWEIAHERAIRRRAPGDISSFMLGVGFKGRNKTDQEIDTFYQDLFRVMGNKDTLSPEEYRDSMSELFKGREWGQGLLIGRKRGFARDEALAYNVLSRVQPGQLDNILDNVQGLVPYSVIQDFYQTKGNNLSTMAETDRVAFNNTIMILNAVIDLPDDATKAQWQAAKDANQRMRTTMEFLHGEDIHELISGYYAVTAEGDLKRWTQAEVWDAQQGYLDAHPQVEEALDTMAEMRLQNPDMAPYYSSIEGLERFGNSLMWDTLTKELGEGIFDEWNEYWNQMLIWDGKITQFAQDNPYVLGIKERRDVMVEEADSQIEGFELINPVVLQIDNAYSDMWEKRAWAIRHESGTTLDKLWQGYWDIPEENKAERRSYYREHEDVLELGKTLKEEGLAHIENVYSEEQIALYEQWDTMTDARWDLYRYGYKDVLKDEGVEQWQFDDYEEYNNMFKLKAEERESIFDDSEGLSRYTELKRELAKQTASEMLKVQQYLPRGLGTRMREDVGQFGDIQQKTHDYLAEQGGRARTYYDYTWTEWMEQIDDPVMNLIEDYIMDGYEVPEALYDNLERVADRMGIITPELLFEMIEDSYR